MSVVDSLSVWGIQRAPEVVELAAEAGLPLNIAAALLEQESGGGRNVWGSDGVSTGGAYVKGAQVTRAAYELYRALRRSGQIGNQGVGPVQLTATGYQDQADQLGGCWDWRCNVTVGFRALANLIRAYGTPDGVRRYNGSGPMAERYREQVLAKAAKWATRIGTVPAAPASPPKPSPLPVPAPDQEDEPVIIPIQVAPDGVFRCISNCETGSASALYSAAWVVFNVGYGSQAGVAADIRVAFRDPAGQVMGPDNDHVIHGLGNDARVSLAAPDGCGSVTVEGRVYGGAIPTVERLSKLR